MDDITHTIEEIQTFSQVNWSRALQVRLSGSTRCGSDGYQISRSAGPLFVYEYVLSGSGTLKIGEELFHPHAGDLYIAPGWQTHSYWSDNRNPWHKYWFNLSGPLVENLPKMYGIEGCWLYHQAEEAGELIRSGVEQLRTLAPKEIPVFMEQHFLRLIQALAARQQPYRENRPAEKTAAWLRSRISGPTPSLAMIAKQLRCSENHAIRQFKQMFGITPVEYFLREKMELAKNLLQNTRKPLKEIAELVGYSDEFYFSRQFKKHCGLPPGTFRRKSC